MRDEQFALLLAEMRAQTQLLRRQALGADARAAVAATVAEEFGDGRFTAAGLCDLADADRGGELAQALAIAVDLSSPHRAVALGIRLKAWPEFEALDEYRRGARLFRLRGG